MADPKAAQLTQLRNIQAKTGHTIQSLHDDVVKTGLIKVGERRAWLMENFKLGYGDANAVALTIGKIPAELAGIGVSDLQQTEGSPLDSLYSGTKAHLRPLHDLVMTAVNAIGPCEQAPKKTYISLRRKKQFAMVGPATKDSIEIGLNAKDLASHPRLKALPAGGMCHATTRIQSPEDVDELLIGWIRQAFDAAG
jgi:hypothetical protein